jgi:SAM-dependent methyltransferase
VVFKDYFSGHARDYAQARPSYPDALFEFLHGQCVEHDLAWDCATGNGQAAVSLAKSFKKVIATDGSAEQVEQAQPARNIEYRQMTAEEAMLEEQCCDLITVAQALHWFDTSRFFDNVKRTLKPDGLLAVWCYGVQRINEPMDAAIEHLYEGILGDYWPVERRLVENDYRDIHFPFACTEQRQFNMTREWTLQQLCGYFTSWSALQRYKKDNDADPLELVLPALTEAWGQDPHQAHLVSWPLTVVLARL